MKFDTKYIDLQNANRINFLGGDLCLKINPIIYTDGERRPRLPRKSSKQTNLQVDTNYLFNYAFGEVNEFYCEISRFAIEIYVYKGHDKLGSGDLDNYCKAILDGITSTKKVWKDDKQVDKIEITRIFRNEETSSSIEITIDKLKQKK